MKRKDIIQKILIGFGSMVGAVLILIGFLAYLCIADCENEWLNAFVCIGGLFFGGLICNEMDKLSKKYPRRSGNFYED